MSLKLLTGAAVGALMTSAAVAQSASDVIIVTGTRAENRTALESVAPIDVISAGELSNNGTTELNVALSYALPSFNFPQPSLTDGTDAIRPATLRGLGPDQTLTLLNGKRRHVTSLVNLNGSVGRGAAAVDLNSIPTAGINAVEVLRDGASAQYGSDAIAGVINVRLREAREGGNVTATYGANVTTVPLYPENGDERDVTDGETLTIGGWVGLPLGAEGFLTVAAEYRDRNATNRSGPDTRPQYSLTAGDFSDPREITFDRINHRFGNPNAEDISVLFNAGLPVNEHVELYAFGTYQNRSADSAGFFRRPADARNVPAIYPDGFLPLITSDVDDYSVAGGARGAVDGWEYDFSITYGTNELDYGVINTLNTTLGPTSPTEFYAGSLKYAQTLVNIDIVRAVPVSFFSGPLNVAFGGEYRNENFEIGAGEEGSYSQGPFPGSPGSQVFPGFQPSNEVDASRDAFSFYVDLEADVTERLTLTTAGRYEHYSDFGDTLTGKFGARFEVNNILALRAGISSGFRAPSLHQIHFTSTATVNNSGVLTETGTFPVGSPEAIALGATPLEPETSLNISAGFVVNTGGFNLTVDGYRITIDDRVVLSENLNRPDIVALLPPGVGAARFFLNGVDSETLGVDVVARYSFGLGELGDITATAGANYNETDLSNIRSTGVLSSLTPPPVLFGRQASLRYEDGYPKSKIIFGFDWTKDPLGGFVRVTRFGETLSAGTSEATDVLLSPQWVLDLEASAEITDNVRVALGANNLLDSYPDNVPFSQSNAGTLPFSSFSPAGFNGRYVYARLAVSW
ncbi:MAG: TonB-dependent receptor [Pseudomonadota bacterium]|nr:TonB-dependent receptor [Pseudomonadota bacterium]